jgi:carboxypeptidase family protein
MKFLRFAVPLLLAGVAAAAALQTPAVSLQGLVLESGSNNPISNATLELVATAGVATGRTLAVSSNDGSFAFRGLRPGQYSLTASRSGYLRAQFGQYGPSSPASTITISGQGVANVRVPLLKSASISGHVYDESGAPAVNAQLHAWRISYKDGWRLPVPVASQMTNDLGEYRLFGLPPGEYYVSAQVDPLTHIRSPASISIAAVAPGAAILSPGPGMFSAILDPVFPRPEPRVEMAPVYYGGTTNEFAATPLHIRPGSDLKAIEIVAKRIPAVSVTGIVLGVDSKPYAPPAGPRATGTPAFVTGPNGERIQVLLNGAPPGGASIVVTPAANQDFLASPAITVLGGVLSVAPLAPVLTNGMGQFRTGAIAPGDYLLTAIANDPQGQRFFAQTAVNLQGVSPSGVSLSLEPSWQIQGRISVEGFAANSTPDLTKLSVRAANAVSALADALPSTPSASGMWMLKNVTSGSYVVTVAPVSNLFASVAPAPPWQNAYVKSIRLGSIDVLENGLRLVSPPTTPLEIVISGRGGSLRGVVRDSNRAILSNVTVVLIPEESNRHRKDLFRSALSDSSGSYHIEGLPPGNYKLFAWEDVEPQMWHDPAFMRVYEDLGKGVAVAETSSQVVDLAGISPLDR